MTGRDGQQTENSHSMPTPDETWGPSATETMHTQPETRSPSHLAPLPGQGPGSGAGGVVPSSTDGNGLSTVRRVAQPVPGGRDSDPESERRLRYVRAKCDDIVEQHSVRRISKNDAFGKIYDLLKVVPCGLPGRSEALDDYREILDEGEARIAAPGGSPVASVANNNDEGDDDIEQPDGDDEPRSGSARPRSPPGNCDGGDGSSPIRATKRIRTSLATLIGERESDASEDDDQGQGRTVKVSHLTDFDKRRQELERTSRARSKSGGAFPWKTAITGGSVNLSPEVVEIRDYLEIWAQDPKLALHDLRLAPGKPPFPVEGWKSILGGEFIDLGKVCSYVLGYATQSDGTAKSVARIATKNDWDAAWDALKAAYLFVFPSRAAELNDYASHIKGYFTRLNVSHHYRVIAYDAEVRQRVALSGNLFLLNDLPRFADIATSHFTDGGIHTGTSQQSSSTSNGARKQSKEPCRNFNTGVCKRNARNCNYRHVCASCGNQGHGSGECTKASK